MPLLVLVGIVFGAFIILSKCNSSKPRKSYSTQEVIKRSSLNIEDCASSIYDISKTFKGKYLGGFSDIEGDKNIELQISKEYKGLKFHFNIFNNSNDKFILFKRITNVEIMSQQQITNGVNLGNLLVLGVFAFALPKKTKVQNYLVIQYKDDKEKERSIIIDVYGGLEETVRELRENIGLT